MDGRTAQRRLLDSLLEEGECEWVEFKKGWFEPERIGHYCSALANGARLCGKGHGYLIWGVADDGTVVGTDLDPGAQKVGQQPFEFWLKGRLTPVGHSVKFVHTEQDGMRVVLLEVAAASDVPVRFSRTAYIRIGEATPRLDDHPDRERRLLSALADSTFESDIACENVSADEVLALLGVGPALQLLSKGPVSDDPARQLEQLRGYKLIERTSGSHWAISNRAAVLFAKDLSDFGTRFERRAPRVVFYTGDDRVGARYEQSGSRGYALGIGGLFRWLEERLPRNETLKGALRVDTPLYPMDALRELIANALIHQDFALRGTAPMIEIFDRRIEISNPGVPLVDVDRMLDESPRSRNEKLAYLMRQMGFCEERGSGIDKVVFGAEVFQLPPPAFEVRSAGFVATMFAPRDFSEMTADERVRACYQHACLLWAGGGKRMTNSTLRGRFGFPEGKASQVSRLISEALEAGAIKPADPDNRSRAQAAYRPYWAL